MFQQLEPRVLLAATFSNGQLTVTGTSLNDDIRLSIENSKLVVREGGQQTGAYSGVKAITVNALAGRDRVVVDAAITVAARLSGGDQPDTLTGGSGNDVLLGDGGHDQLFGGAGKDAVLGGSGNDLLDGGTGDDYLDGQSGGDTVTYAGRTQPVSASIINYYDTDATRGGGGASGENDRFASAETLIGGSGNDRLMGAHYNYVDPDDTIPRGHGEGYFFALYGGPGDDQFLPDDNATLARWYGDAGNDVFDLRTDEDSSLNHYEGGSGTDTFILDKVRPVGSTYTHLAPDVENAIIYGFNGSEFHGNALNNRITIYDWRTEFAIVHGEAGDDRIILAEDSAGQEDVWTRVYGDAGNDRIESLAGRRIHAYGGDNNDVINGSSGNDTLEGGGGDDALFGKGGDDVLVGNDGNDYLEGGDGVDAHFGGNGNDVLRGNGGADYFEGGAGDDLFYTRDGTKERIYGGAGHDRAQRDDAEAILDSVEQRVS